MTTFLLAIALLAPAAEDYGPWQVRRGRTVDAATAGGWPVYQVTFSGPPETPDVAIADEPSGAGRGTVLIGRQVTVAKDRLPALEFTYTATSPETKRRPRLELVVIEPAAWDKLGHEARAEVVFNAGDRAQCAATVMLLSHVGDDVSQPTAVPVTAQRAFSNLLRRFAGREVVLAVAFTGLHGAPERGTLRGLKVTTMPPHDPLATLLSRLDLTLPALAEVKAAADRGDRPAALAALLAYYRARQTPPLPHDPRGKPRPKASARRLEEAEAAFQNRFIGQGNYGLQQVPAEIDWSFNPGQDPEWTWQFNRHSAWHALAHAYRATGDEKYARRWLELLRDWVAKNPPGTPYSWRTIEAGIRGQGWASIYAAFLDSPSLTPADHALMLASLADHAEYLLPDGRFSSGSNWGMIESGGLLTIGTYFPEFAAAKQWRETAWQRVEGELAKQVLADGAQVELTTGYHVGVLSLFLDAAELAAVGGVKPRAGFYERLEHMYEYSMILSKPDGSQPMPGDSWPGSLRSTIAAGGRRFNRADLLYVGTGGKEGTKPDHLDSALPQAGYYVMRTDWVDPQALYVLCDVAHRWGGGHQHPDALQLDLYAFGQTLLPDTGSYLYYGPGRAAACRTAAHNTVCVDEANQNTQPAVLHRFASQPALSYLDGSHPGYPGVTTRRQVLFARPGHGAPPYLLVIDKVTGDGSHTVDQNWHFRPGTARFDEAGRLAQTTNSDGPNLRVQSLVTDRVSLAPVESFVSFVYTRQEPRPAVRFRQTGALPMTFVTLLVPYAKATAPELTARLLPGANAEQVVAEVSGPGFRDVLFARREPGETGLAGVAVARAGLVRTAVGGPGGVRQLVDGR